MNSFEARLYSEVKAALEDEVASQIDALATGTARDFAEYKERAGVIRGLRLALDRAAEIHHRLATLAG